MWVSYLVDAQVHGIRAGDRCFFTDQSQVHPSAIAGAEGTGFDPHQDVSRSWFRAWPCLQRRLGRPGFLLKIMACMMSRLQATRVAVGVVEVVASGRRTPLISNQRHSETSAMSAGNMMKG